MFLQMTDGALYLIQEDTGPTGYTDIDIEVPYLYMGELAPNVSWTKTSASGVSFSWDGHGNYTVSDGQGHTFSVRQLQYDLYRYFAGLYYNYDGTIGIYNFYIHSEVVYSGGNRHYYCFALDGETNGSFNSYELFLASWALYGQPFMVSINANSSGGGRVYGTQHLYDNGDTYYLGWGRDSHWTIPADITAALSNDITDGYSVTYNLTNCEGNTNNPTVIPPDNTSTEFIFTPTGNAYFDAYSVTVDAPEGHAIEKTWDPETGVLTLGVVDCNITINVTAYVDSDPYDPAGNTGDDDTPGDGGDGDFDDDTDPIPIPDIPDETDVSASNSRFITLFAPTTGQLNDLANYMWSTSFDLDTFKKLFANPMDCILGLSTIPFTPTTNGTGTVTVGNISTGVSMTKCKQYKEIDCGTINVKKYWGAYLDYAPFTKAEIYLPFIGMRPLTVDDIMGKSVHVVYHVDVLSGACVAYIKCGNSVLYNFVGQCSQSIPVTSNDFTNVVNGALGIAGAIGSMVASGGASAPYAAGTLVSSAINALKPNIERSGGLAGGASMMEIKKPYLVLTRPKQALAKNQSKYMGLPTWITRKLSSVSGYTKVEHIKLGGTHATEEEQKEIIALLKEGVFL